MKEIKKKIHPAQIIVLILLMAFGVLAGNISPRLKVARGAVENFQRVLNPPSPTPPYCRAMAGAKIDSNSFECDNLDLIIDGVAFTGANVTISGHHVFKNVYIRNGGKLTHEAVDGTLNTGDIDITKLPNEAGYLKPSGQVKKVDIEADNIILETGGQINVDGKGYPGVTPYFNYGGPNCEDVGYGQGSGWSSLNESAINAGGGGSYGGKGGKSYIDTFCPAGQSTYGNQQSPTDFGSPGGSCYSNGQYAGLAGGGRIKVIANKIEIKDTLSQISANGVGQGGWSQRCAPGDGSGGSVWILTNTLVTPSVGQQMSANGGEWIFEEIQEKCPPSYWWCPGIYAEDGTINKDDTAFPGTYTNIFANGGNAYRNGGPGGGGRIALSLPPMPLLPPNVESQTIKVKVTWPEGARTETVELKAFLKNIR